MANIAMNNFCNLHCPYCFANHFIADEDKTWITVEQLERILDFISRTYDLNAPGNPRIGLIGGEPTLHPHIGDIMKKVDEFSRMYRCNWSMFSNGIKLHEILEYFNGPNTGCLINVNHPDVLGEDNWNELIHSFDRITRRYIKQYFSIGINLYPNIPDYDFIFEIAQKYQFDKIRTSYVAPTNEFEGSNKDEFYENAKSIVIPFVQKAYNLGIQVNLDCNKIPLCYFSDCERQLMMDATHGQNFFCRPVIDISPDFKATPCFGSYELVSLEDFENIHEVERYFYLHSMYPLAQKNCSVGKCADCNKAKNLSCQGGCLAFAKYMKEG